MIVLYFVSGSPFISHLEEEQISLFIQVSPNIDWAIFVDKVTGKIIREYHKKRENNV